MKSNKAGVAVAVVAIAMAFELGCAPAVVTIGALDVAPKPPSVVPRGQLTLAVAPATPDAVRIAVRGLPAVEIRAFRATLRRAFESAFGPASASGRSAVADRLLEVEVTSIAFVTHREAREVRRMSRPFGAEVVLTHGVGTPHPARPGVRFRYAQLGFKASIRRRGVKVAHLSGFAVADRGTSGGADSIASSLGSSVAVLYERIGRELLSSSVLVQSERL